MLPSLSPEELLERLKQRMPKTLLDIRDKEEFDMWTIYGSINIPESKLRTKYPQINKKQPVIVFCNRGNSSKKAASFLRTKGFDAIHLTGGLRAWNSIFDIVEVIPIQASSSRIFQFKRFGKGCLSYALILPGKTHAILIDPTTHKDMYLKFLEERKLKLLAVLDTHIHADHVSGARLLARSKKVPYLLPEQSKVTFSFTPMEKALPKLLKNVPHKIIPTPGHTPESIALTIGQSFCFTGDTLFLDTVGRPDLGSNLEEDATLLFTSIKDKLFPLSEDIFVLSAHAQVPMVPGPVQSASLRYIRRINMIAKVRSAERFIEMLRAHDTPTPSNFKKIKKLNTSGSINQTTDYSDMELGTNACAVEIA